MFRRAMMNRQRPARDYQTAIDLLNTLQTNAATLEAIRRNRDQAKHRSLPEMRWFIQRLGYACSDFDALRPIHVAGTKGKGSTSALIESILRRVPHSSGSGGLKTGLFTSPHLVQVRERIRLNGKPLSADLFSSYFFDVWDRLQASRTDDPRSFGPLSELMQEDPNYTPPLLPTYFRYLTLMALHVFLRERVHVAVIEVGIGGEYDCTNILERPAVCALTSIGFDHQALLGSTLAEIAWHKAGIMKPQVLALSCPGQDPSVLEVFRKRSVERQTLGFEVVPALSRLQTLWEGRRRRLGLAGDHQWTNAALAVAVCQHWARMHGANNNNNNNNGGGLSDDTLEEGLVKARWPGRAQKVEDGVTGNGLRFYLDGAHTPESLDVCALWFQQELSQFEKTTARALLFHCSRGRNPDALLQPLIALHRQLPFDVVIFSTNDVSSNHERLNAMVQPEQSKADQQALERSWRKQVLKEEEEQKKEKESPAVSVHCTATVAEALSMLRSYPVEIGPVLVTGSLHLVGAVLSELNFVEEETD